MVQKHHLVLHLLFCKTNYIGEKTLFFDKPKMIASQINETNELSGQKSFFLDLENKSERKLITSY